MHSNFIIIPHLHNELKNLEEYFLNVISLFEVNLDNTLVYKNLIQIERQVRFYSNNISLDFRICSVVL